MSKQQVIVESKAVGFGKSEKKVKGLNTALGGLATKAMGVAGAYFGARGVINALKSSLDLYAEQQLAEVKLEAALGKTSIGLQRYASALQRTTRFGDELILQGMAQLAFFIKDEEQLKVATKATLDLASAKGMDLVQAADLVAKSVGSSTNALSRYGIAAEGAVGSEERLLSITDEIANLFGGQAEATTESYQGAIDQLSNAFGDMQEIIGQRLAPTVMSLAQGFTAMIQSSPSEQTREEVNTFSALLDILQDTNISTATRELTLKKLKTEYPDYLGAMDLEKASLKEIKALQVDTMAEMENRITQMIFLEELNSNATKLKRAELDLFKLEEEARKDLSHLIILNSGNTIDTMAIEIENKRLYIEKLKEEQEQIKNTQAAYLEANPIVEEANNKSVESKEKESELLDTLAPKEIEFNTIKNTQKQKEIDLTEKLITVSRTKATMMKINAGMEVASNSQIAGSFAALNEAAGGSAEMTRNLTIAQAFADAYAGSVRAFKDYPAPASFVVSASVIASGLAAAYNAQNAYEQHMDSKQSQYGFEGVVDQPTQFTVGEGGASEFVSVTPMEGVDNSGAGTGITVNIQGNVMTEEFVEGELADRIADAVRRGTDFGMS